MKSNVLLPLYFYPNPGTWAPLYEAILAHPELHFLVIINPHNGPGATPWWPNEDYVREIPQLNACPNVTVVGYVYATYCKRPVKDIYEDIEKYAAWLDDERIPGLGVRGIFVDETVNLYSYEAKSYLDGIDQKIKDSDGITGKRMVIHNPGTAVNGELATPGPDITVVVETSYEHFITKEYQEWLSTSPYDRSRSCYMLHSVPEEKIDAVTTALRERVAYLFLTSATKNFYGGFAPSWVVFLEAMAKLAK